MDLILGVMGVVIGIYFIKISKKITLFQFYEAKRYFMDFNKIDNNWSSRGRVYTNGIALLKHKKDGEKFFIKQAEHCDIGILS